MARSPRDFDITIYGATGFTGAFVVLELARLMEARHSTLPATSAPLRVALAGRSRSRLEAVLARVRASHAAFSASLVIADSDDAESLHAMAANSRLVLSCAGPFRRLGEPVIAACIAEGTHYADVTGEPEFMERVELTHGDAAARAGVIIVPCCGFDSIPADIGVAFAARILRNHGAVPTRCESYLTLSGGPLGVVGHFATYESAVLGLGSVPELRAVRRAFANAHPTLAHVPLWGAPLPKRGSVFWAASERRWALPFPGSDASVVKRTQRTLLAQQQEREQQQRVEQQVVPISYAAFFTLPSTYAVVIAALMGGVMRTLSAWAWGRRLLLAAPGFFTGGLFSHAGPSPAQMAATSFTMTFYASGYRMGEGGGAAAMLAGGGLTRGSGGSGRSRTPGGGITPSPDASVCVRVSGPEPGYVATPRILLSAAFTLLDMTRGGQENAQSGEGGAVIRGGVFTPAAAFQGPHCDALVSRLCALGVTYEEL